MSLFGELEKPEDLDATVRLRLADSLAHIFERAHDRLDLDAPRFESAKDRIRSQRQDPGVFARYYDAVFAIGANDLPLAKALLEELAERAHQPVSFEIAAYAPGLGSDYERFPRLLFAEYSKASPMASPTPGETASFTRHVAEAIDIVGNVDPGIHDEIKGLLVRIYLAAPSNAPGAKRFGGVTSFLAWGASFINIGSYKTRWDAVQFLVHEITHALLFGLACDEPLVKNAADESYKSPLRSDPRPMDGIFHATMVCGRLADFNRAWLEGGRAGRDERACEKAVVDNSRAFRDGLAVIEEHGKLSPLAEQLIDRSRQGLSVPV